MADKEKLKAALYYRVSSESQAEQHTIESQKTELPIYAERQGWEVSATYEDEGISGSFISGRKSFLKLLDDCKRGLFDILLMVDSARISRSDDMAEWGLIFNALKEGGVKLASPMDGVQSVESLEDLLMFSLRRYAAAKDNEARTETMKRGKRQRLREGSYAAAVVPYGFRRVTKGKGKDKINKIILNKKECQVLRSIYDWIVNEGHSLVWCVVELNRQAEAATGPWTKQGRRWSTGNLNSILKNRDTLTGCIIANRARYKKIGINKNGRLRFKKLPDAPESEWIKFAVPQIFSEEEYKVLRERIAANKIEHAVTNPNKFLLRRMIKCGLCGATMATVTGGNVGGKRSDYYVCTNRLKAPKLATKPKCDCPRVNAKFIDALILQKFLVELRTDPKKVLNEWEMAGHKKTAIAKTENQIKSVEKQIKKQEQEKLRVLDLAATITGWSKKDIQSKLEKINGIITGLEAEKVGLKKELKDNETMQANVEVLDEGIQELKHHLSIISDLRGLGVIKEGGKHSKKADALEKRLKKILVNRTIGKDIVGMSLSDQRRLIENFLQESFIEILPRKKPSKFKLFPDISSRKLSINWIFKISGKMNLGIIINALKEWEETGQMPNYYQSKQGIGQYSVYQREPGFHLFHYRS